MKTLRIFSVLLFSTFFIGGNYAQDLIHAGIKGSLTENQKKSLVKSNSMIKTANKTLTKAQNIEKKYKDLKESKKKRKQKKWEKKSWEAKKFRIKAENEYQKAYQRAYDVYSTVINKSDYAEQKDEDKARKINNEAETSLIDAEKEITNYIKKTSEEALAVIKYKDVVTSMSKARKLKTKCLNKQFEALDIVAKQRSKISIAEEESKTWYFIENEGTITAYERYIKNYPKGKFVAKAKSRIHELKFGKEEVVEKTEYTFKVQIAASKIPLSKSNLKSRYSDISKIERVYDDKNYKYRVGTFTTYQEAAEIRDTFEPSLEVFVVVFDKDGNQINVTEEMKQ